MFRLSGCSFVILLLTAGISASAQTAHPVADPRAIVVSGQARFTVLTPQLMRLEWAADSRFEDHASLVFINRRLPVPQFTTREENEWLTIQTEKLKLEYRIGSGRFTKDNLRILLEVDGKPVAWFPGMENRGNLRGTIRTLDGVEGATGLEPGLLSRDGWTLVDDTERPVFDGSEWPWVMPRPDGARQDFMFFGYGLDYTRALKDFVSVAGRIPMPPRFAFGLWWSRYWAYTDQEFKDLVREFETYSVPLDVLVIDMDWHLTFDLRWDKKVLDQAGQRLGWTGYTWDRIYFPDPDGFLSWCERRGLKTPLNLHPASGVQPHEERYPEMARAMGIDPATKRYVPFDIVDKKFATNFMEIIIRPLERQGVDFWWLDWQQWSTTKIPGVTPTWWLNYVFFTDMERRGKERPLLFHRWGGLGNHRYQIGFSGDAISVWKSLAFQPYFTATAANVCYGYWSHDIGGHMPGPVSAELYTRWIQWGVFSPIVRTHTTKNPAAERRIWAYPPEYFRIMRDAVLLRYSLIPYIYTAARQAYETGVSVCRPMYYHYPEAEEAYTFTDQYMFGDDILLAPVTEPVSPDSLLAVKRIWLPPGSWIEWWSGTKLQGPAVTERLYAIDEIPAFARAGAIIPMQPAMRHVGERPVDPLILTIFPGMSGATRVYEDEGTSLGYRRGEFAWTSIRMERISSTTLKIDVLPREGSYPGMPEGRAYEVRLERSWPPVSVTCNGRTIPYSGDEVVPGWRYDGEKLLTIIPTPKFSSQERVEIIVELDAKLEERSELLDGVPNALRRLKRTTALVNQAWPSEWSPEILVRAAQTGNRIGIDPKSAAAELERLRQDFPEIISRVQGLDIDTSIVRRSVNHLKSILQ